LAPGERQAPSGPAGHTASRRGLIDSNNSQRRQEHQRSWADMSLCKLPAQRGGSNPTRPKDPECHPTRYPERAAPRRRQTDPRRAEERTDAATDDKTGTGAPQGRPTATGQCEHVKTPIRRKHKAARKFAMQNRELRPAVDGAPAGHGRGAQMRGGMPPINPCGHAEREEKEHVSKLSLKFYKSQKYAQSRKVPSTGARQNATGASSRPERPQTLCKTVGHLRRPRHALCSTRAGDPIAGNQSRRCHSEILQSLLVLINVQNLHPAFCALPKYVLLKTEPAEKIFSGSCLYP